MDRVCHATAAPKITSAGRERLIDGKCGGQLLPVVYCRIHVPRQVGAGAKGLAPCPRSRPAPELAHLAAHGLDKRDLSADPSDLDQRHRQTVVERASHARRGTRRCKSLARTRSKHISYQSPARPKHQTPTLPGQVGTPLPTLALLRAFAGETARASTQPVAGSQVSMASNSAQAWATAAVFALGAASGAAVALVARPRRCGAGSSSGPPPSLPPAPQPTESRCLNTTTTNHTLDAATQRHDHDHHDHDADATADLTPRFVDTPHPDWTPGTPQPGPYASEAMVQLDPAVMDAASV